MPIPIGTWLAYLAIGERLVRLWGSFKRAIGRKKERDKEQNRNTDGNLPDRPDS